jgi:hypothetical protein
MLPHARPRGGLFHARWYHGNMNDLIAATIYVGMLVGLFIAVFATNNLVDNNWRFGLRALLVAMTLVALALVVVGYALRR